MGAILDAICVWYFIRIMKRLFSMQWIILRSFSSVCLLPAYLSYSSIYHSLSLAHSIYLFVSLYLYYLHVCLSICLPVYHLSICLSTFCLSISPSASLSVALPHKQTFPSPKSNKSLKVQKMFIIQSWMTSFQSASCEITDLSPQFRRGGGGG